MNTFKMVSSRAKLAEYKKTHEQLFEIIVLFMSRRIGPGYYHLAEIGRTDKGWKYLFDFANAKQYHRAVNRINNPLFRKVSQHKALEKAVMTAFGIPTSPLLGHLHPGHGLSVTGDDLKDLAGLLKLLAEQIGKTVCFKPVEGFGGSGFEACEVRTKGGDILLKGLKDGAVLTASGFLNRLKWNTGMVVESYIEQHPDLAKFHPTSVNSVRVLVLRGETGKTSCLGTTFRIGQGGSVVDNASAGGIMANVHTGTGVMDAGVFMKPSLDVFICHPDTKVPIAGEVLPHFKEMQDLACKALDAFPGIGFAGVDVTYGKDGAMVIEMNPEPDYVFMAINRLGSRALLGV